MELEELGDEQKENGEVNHANFLMKQAMRSMMEAFQSLKARKTQARMAFEEDGRRASPLDTTAGVSATPARALQLWKQCREAYQNHSTGGCWNHKPMKKVLPLGVKFDGDSQQLGFFLAHILTYM